MLQPFWESSWNGARCSRTNIRGAPPAHTSRKQARGTKADHQTHNRA